LRVADFRVAAAAVEDIAVLDSSGARKVFAIKVIQRLYFYSPILYSDYQIIT
jgi:hypothetical protein